MQVGTLPVANRATTGSAGVSADIRQTLTQIAQAPGLTEPERTSLVQATATANSIASAELRSVALNQISSMGLYLSRTGDNGLPRWSVMTALRAYGLNLQSAPKAQTAEQNAIAAQNVAKQVVAAGAERGVSVAQALQAVPQAQAVAVAATPLQIKNAAVVNLGGLPASGGSGDGDAADLTTQLLNTLV